MSEAQDAYQAGWDSGWDACMRRHMKLRAPMTVSPRQSLPRRGPSSPAKKPRKASAYSKRYGKAFKRLAPKYKKKSGGWKKNGFRLCAAAARKAAKK